MSINMHLIVSIFSFSNRNENFVMLVMSSQLKRKAEKSESHKRHDRAVAHQPAAADSGSCQQLS